MEPTLEEVRVLIVDDSMIVRKAVRKAVVGAGVDDKNIREAGHGEAALHALDDGPADVIFLDINMPVMDGERFMEVLDESGRSHRHYVVIVSTEVNAKRLMRMATMGARARLKKPFEPERLRELIVEAAKEKAESAPAAAEAAPDPPPVDPGVLAETLSLALETMCFVIADPVDARPAEDLEHHASITIGDDDVKWKLMLSSSAGLLIEVASGLMGLEPEEMDLDEVLPETILELANVFGGEVINLLGGEELPYRPGIPHREDECHTAGPGEQVLHFDAMGEGLTVCLAPARSEVHG